MNKITAIVEAIGLNSMSKMNNTVRIILLIVAVILTAIALNKSEDPDLDLQIFGCAFILRTVLCVMAYIQTTFDFSLEIVAIVFIIIIGMIIGKGNKSFWIGLIFIYEIWILSEITICFFKWLAIFLLTVIIKKIA